MSLLPDPAELRAIADRIAGHAGAARARAEILAAAVESAGWHGFAAGAFHQSSDGVLTGLRGSAGRLDDAAAVLRVHADRVADVLAELRRLGNDLAHAGDDLLATAGDVVMSPGSLAHDAGHLVHDAGHLVHDAGGLVHDAGGLARDALHLLGR